MRYLLIAFFLVLSPQVEARTKHVSVDRLAQLQAQIVAQDARIKTLEFRLTTVTNVVQAILKDDEEDKPSTEMLLVDLLRRK
jgi:hypothetical protein